MGSSGESSGKGIDASVGGLVWVRRRNGSWWPGRIVGLDELSECCLVSPRSGTPVKLLGREDASIDWYNLEKSKRVKAFRCGDYEECIAKAKASAASSNKKTVKYARREDAILHALELEGAHLCKDGSDFCSNFDACSNKDSQELPPHHLKETEFCSKGDGPCAEDSPHSSKETEDTEETSLFEETSNSPVELSHSGVSFEEHNSDSVPKVQSMQGRRRKTPNDSEDDGTEGIKRMRGLEDLGLGRVQNRKVSAEGSLEQVRNENSVPTEGPSNVGKNNFPSSRRKRTQVAYVHEFLKRKNRRRPLTKVLESTAMVSVPVTCDQLASLAEPPPLGLSDDKSKISGLESIESKCTVVTNNSSDSTLASLENGGSLNDSHLVCEASIAQQKPRRLKEDGIPGVSGLPENHSPGRLFDVPFIGEEKHSADLHAFASCSSEKTEVGASTTQPNHSSQADIRMQESGSTCLEAARGNGIGQSMENSASKWQSKGKRNSRHTGRITKRTSRNSGDMDNESDDYFDFVSMRSGSNSADSLKLKPKSKSIGGDRVDGFPGWRKRVPHPDLSGCSPTLQRPRPYRHSRFTAGFPIRSFGAGSSLYDVNIEVKAQYRPQRVPLVSLMSKLNGKAIVGHPLPVEVLGDGFCDQLMNNVEWYPNCSVGVASKAGHAVVPSPEAGKIIRTRRASKPRLLPSKSPRLRKSGLLQKKTRTLSSLTRLREDRKVLLDKSKGPAMACIPVKVVFSRLNEDVGGSARPAQVRQISSPANR